MDRGELEDLDRESLVVRAQAAGIRRARILTRPELIDELLRLDPDADAAQLKKSRGFFGRARDLVARVVERGLHLPDAADRIRTMALGTTIPTTAVPRTEPQAMPTVTLAEIYAAQGHRQRAIETLRRVLDREPDHTAARALLARLEDE
jgi:tetratricopeptide (TPR) repeat protein